MDDLSFLGLDADKVEKVRAFIIRSVSAGIEQGGQRVAARYGAAMKWQVGATVVTAGLAAAILIVLLVGD